MYVLWHLKYVCLLGISKVVLEAIILSLFSNYGNILAKW